MIVLPDGRPYTGPVAKSEPKPDPYLLRVLIGSSLFWNLSEERRNELMRIAAELEAKRLEEEP